MPSPTLEKPSEHPEILRLAWLPNNVTEHEIKNLQEKGHIKIATIVDLGSYVFSNVPQMLHNARVIAELEAGTLLHGGDSGN